VGSEMCIRDSNHTDKKFPAAPTPPPPYRNTPRTKIKRPLQKITKLLYTSPNFRSAIPSMAYQTTIDYDVPIADFSPTFESLETRVAAAMSALVDADGLPNPEEINEDDKELARAIFSGQQLASDQDLSSPPVVVYLQSLLNEYDKVVIKSAAQLRTYVTNKLLAETANADPRIRLKSLELLGKVSDVGLFTDKTEITMRHRPTEELEQLLRERLTKVIEAEVTPNTRPEPPEISVDDVETH
jgi:hypothetical protein